MRYTLDAWTPGFQKIERGNTMAKTKAAKKVTAPKPDPAPMPIPYNVRTAPTSPVLSAGMASLLYGGESPRFIIVRSSEGSITNREEFSRDMASLGFKAIFLEYSKFASREPRLSLVQKNLLED
jgi:hypothetical protein